MPQLHSLQCCYHPDLQGLGQAAALPSAQARAPLRHLTLCGDADVEELLTALSSSSDLGVHIHSLVLKSTYLPSGRITRLLGLVPNLRSLDLSQWAIAEPAAPRSHDVYPAL